LKSLIDPRHGDVEDDASSTKQKSLLSLAGSLLAEISLFKLILAWIWLMVLPALILGATPIAAAVWFAKFSDHAVTGLWSAMLLVLLLALGWFAGRKLFRIAESSFWSLNSLAVQPAYTICREVLRHVAGWFVSTTSTQELRSTVHTVTALAAGFVVCAIAIIVLIVVWPGAYLLPGSVAIVVTPKLLATTALTNGIVLVCAYVAGAALVWAIADGTMAAPRDVETFASGPGYGRRWRIAHLSDIHVVAERYGFRIESGRSGARGNERLIRIFEQLENIHADEPLHVILITGDVTDAGRSAEWAEFFDGVARHPGLADIMLIIPGNHDVNIVDRANPARLDLPTSPKKRLRQIRALSAMVALQGARVRVVGDDWQTLAAALAPDVGELTKFSDAGRPRLSPKIMNAWARTFPLVLPPDTPDGLGIILLNSNADTHFSFTNALGMLPAEQALRIKTIRERYPDAYWVIALHHHLVEYPRATKALSERIGTALINGNWFVRYLKFMRGRAVLMHGHRHIDWIGECSGLPIVSAPSPVMEATNDETTRFYIHTLAVGADRTLKLMPPRPIEIVGKAPAER
jgi:3',5'-cyclic AMP phosphodiesterase CpdA